MKRYKELKFNKKTYTEQYKIDEILLKEGFQWFLDCEVEEVRIEISQKTLIFNAGTFFNGTWKYGVFRDGVWKYGIWENGVWYNGKWFNGVFQDGIIFDGKFHHGKIEKGEIKGGHFYNMEISEGVIKKKDEKQEKEEDIKVPKGEKITEKHMNKNIMSFDDFKKFNENVLSGNLTPLFMASGIANVMKNRTFRHTEELVDLKNKKVELSSIDKYCQENIDGWNGISDDVKNRVKEIVIKDFEKSGYEVI